LRGIDQRVQALERPGSTRGELDDVASAVLRVTDPADQAALLQVVEDRVEVVLVPTELGAELGDEPGSECSRVADLPRDRCEVLSDLARQLVFSREAALVDMAATLTASSGPA
jgi:hypothetical protein